MKNYYPELDEIYDIETVIEANDCFHEYRKAEMIEWLLGAIQAYDLEFAFTKEELYEMNPMQIEKIYNLCSAIYNEKRY